MAIINSNANIAYGLSEALIGVFPAPIVSNRDPKTSDKAPIGSEWVNKSTNSVFFLTSVVANSANWVSTSGGSGLFSSLTVNPGDITVTAGDINVIAGDVTLTSGQFISNTAVFNNGIAIPNAIGSAINIDGDGVIIIGNDKNTTTAPLVEFSKDRLNGVITSGDGLGSITFTGYDGTSYIVGSQILSVNSGTVATNRIASNLEFFTHPDSTAASTLRMTIASTGAVTIATPDSGVALTITGGGATVTAGNVLVTAGNITASAGNIVATAGSMSANTTITAGGAITSTAGKVLGVTLAATGDTAGTASQTSITNVVNTSVSTGVMVVLSTTANPGNSAGFIKIYVGTVVNYIPYFTNIAP